jgi:hypothetical protein
MAFKFCRSNRISISISGERHWRRRVRDAAQNYDQFADAILGKLVTEFLRFGSGGSWLNSSRQDRFSREPQAVADALPGEDVSAPG